MIWLVLLQLLSWNVGNCQHSEFLLNIEHKIGSGEWSKRATVILPTIKQSSLPSHNKPQYIPVSSNERVDELKSAASQNDTLYFIRTNHKVLEEGEISESEGFVTIVVRPCSIIEADLVHDLTIHMDNSGYVTGLSLQTKTEECVGKTTSASSFSTDTKVSYPVIGASPDVNTFIQMKEAEDRKKTDESKDTRSFFAKYWMYIVPAVLFLMMSMGGS